MPTIGKNQISIHINIPIPVPAASASLMVPFVLYRKSQLATERHGSCASIHLLAYLGELIVCTARTDLSVPNCTVRSAATAVVRNRKSKNEWPEGPRRQAFHFSEKQVHRLSLPPRRQPSFLAGELAYNVPARMLADTEARRIISLPLALVVSLLSPCGYCPSACGAIAGYATTGLPRIIG